MTSAFRPTEAELAILHVLWDHGPQSVRDIQRVMNAARPTGYTTVLKLLQIMTTKGLVDRDDSVRPQVYRAHHSRQRTQRQLLRHLTDRAFGGSVKSLVMQAVAGRRSNPDELAALEQLLDKIERESS